MPVLSASIEGFPVAGQWSISRGSVDKVELVCVELEEDGFIGRGECRPYARYDETPVSVHETLLGLQDKVRHVHEPEDVQPLLPAGAARNALDCAYWDLKAKQSGQPVWRMAGLPEPRPLLTAVSISLDTPDRMQAMAAAHADKPLLKIKLGRDGDLDRIRAVRRGAPRARIIVDANEGWTPEIYQHLAPEFVTLGVEMVEQPLPAWADEALAQMERVLPVCADESCHDAASLDALVGKYDMVNIKLDKTGGLTEAMNLRNMAENMGFEVMVGCMLASSLSMAPAALLAQGAEIVDLDGPLLLKQDRRDGLVLEGASIHPHRPELWG